ncbi:hypothetical protein SEUCBS140593_006540 [Sporothrix eucalyptigena]|uniref:Uncharacterized protein n=1 Tax=Sporothrix eucalyptigena TaxID=1812306 RepID=A0ABP0C7Y9_9PEZI
MPDDERASYYVRRLLPSAGPMQPEEGEDSPAVTKQDWAAILLRADDALACVAYIHALVAITQLLTADPSVYAQTINAAYGPLRHMPLHLGARFDRLPLLAADGLSSRKYSEVVNAVDAQVGKSYHMLRRRYWWARADAQNNAGEVPTESTVLTAMHPNDHPREFI